MSTEPITVALAKLTREAELCVRAEGLDLDTVAEYAALFSAGVALPPIEVVDVKGALLLVNGWHRVEAAARIGLHELPALRRTGTRKDAVLAACSANHDHGLKRSQADRRLAVKRVIATWPGWSDRKVAEAARVDHKTVAAVRRTLAEVGNSPPQDDAASSAPVPVDVGKLAERLAKAFARSLERLPEAQRGELRAALLRLLEGLS